MTQLHVQEHSGTTRYARLPSSTRFDSTLSRGSDVFHVELRNPRLVVATFGPQRTISYWSTTNILRLASRAL